MKFIFVLTVVLFCSSFSSAQQNKIDSLLLLLNADNEDTNKVNYLDQLCEAFHKNGNYNNSLEYGNAALKLAKKIKFQKGIAKAYNNIGSIFYEQGNYDLALENHFASLKIKEEIGDKVGIAMSYNNIGSIFYEQGNFDKALEKFYASLKMAVELGNKYGTALLYNNIGNIYNEQGNYDKALENLFASLRIAEELGNKYGTALLYNNIAAVYRMQGNYDKALEKNFASLKIQEEIGDKKGIANSYNNIAGGYFEQGNYDMALEYDFASLKIKKEIGDKQGIAVSYNNIGNLYFKQNKIAEAKKQSLASLSIAEEIGSKDDIKQAYDLLTRCDSAAGNWKSAYEYHKLYKLYNDSIFNEESNKQIAEMSTKYETEKKEKEIELQKTQIEKKDAENKKQQYVIWFVAISLLLVAVFTVFIWRAFIQKKMTNKKLEKKNATIEQQKEEIAHKNKDLTDSILYAERIQRAILTSEQYLNDMFLPQQQIASHFILYKPKDIVAGDFYWAYKTQSGKAIWLAADCTGHGVPGAFMSMIGNSLLNEIVVEKGIDQPAEILNALRAGIIKAVGQSGSTGIKDGMDCALCCWDKAINKIIFSGANNSLWILRNNEFIEINPDKQPVGNYTGQLLSFTQKEFELQQGDTLYTFTDGYCDQFGGTKGKKFKYKPFKELLISIQDKSMSEQREILDKTINEWRGEVEQIDDICVFGVRV